MLIFKGKRPIRILTSKLRSIHEKNTKEIENIYIDIYLLICSTYICPYLASQLTLSNGLYFGQGSTSKYALARLFIPKIIEIKIQSYSSNYFISY